MIKLAIPSMNMGRLFERVRWSLFTFIFCCQYAIAEAENTAIYLYSPDTVSGSSATLKRTMDEYFRSEHYPFELQPVKNQAQFEILTSRAKSSFFILSYWELEKLSKKGIFLSARFQGVKDNSSTYRQVLVSKIQSMEELFKPGHTLASAVDESITHQSLNSISRQSHRNFSPDDFLYLQVPKGIDALMAVQFGLADAALASEHSFHDVTRIYPVQNSGVRVLGITHPLPRLMIAEHDNIESLNASTVATLRKAIMNMHRSEKGQTGLGLLGLDRWARISESGIAEAVAGSDKGGPRQDGE